MTLDTAVAAAASFVATLVEAVNTSAVASVFTALLKAIVAGEAATFLVVLSSIIRSSARSSNRTAGLCSLMDGTTKALSQATTGVDGATRALSQATTGEGMVDSTASLTEELPVGKEAWVVAEVGHVRA